MTLGVIIGRFQVPRLHKGHEEMLRIASEHSDNILVLLGTNKVHEHRPTRKNPLSYKCRKSMVMDSLRNYAGKKHLDSYKSQLWFGVDCLYDMAEDEKWSKQVDTIIKSKLKENEPAIIFHGRDSFKPHYCGVYPTFELKISSLSAGSFIRDAIKDEEMHSADHRTAVIHTVMNRSLCVYPTVDVAAIFEIKGAHGSAWEILLGRKPNETKWRLPGGFVDVTDFSYLEAAGRELHEETGMEPEDGALEYIESFLGNDWRYPPGGDRIMTTLFEKVCESKDRAKAGDDLEEIQWFNLFDPDLPIINNHKDLVNAIVERHKQYD